MLFSEKLREARNNAGMTQSELADKAGIPLRMLVVYERGEHYPRRRAIYLNLADALDVPQEHLLTEDELIVVEAAERYGYRGATQAEDLLREFDRIRASSDLSEGDKKAVIEALRQIFLDSKARNKEKYTPKLYRAEPATGLL